MPTCQNCNSFVSKDFVRVFEPDGIKDPRACPKCVDKVRTGGKIRDARSRR
jgi:hypothetical protein